LVRISASSKQPATSSAPSNATTSIGRLIGGEILRLEQFRRFDVAVLHLGMQRAVFAARVRPPGPSYRCRWRSTVFRPTYRRPIGPLAIALMALPAPRKSFSAAASVARVSNLCTSLATHCRRTG